jgi:hypothetical protein
MREAVETFISTLHDCGLIVSRKAFDAVEKVRTALAAPIPPPDGAGEDKLADLIEDHIDRNPGFDGRSIAQVAVQFLSPPPDGADGLTRENYDSAAVPKQAAFNCRNKATGACLNFCGLSVCAPKQAENPLPAPDGASELIKAFTRLERRLMSYCNHANAGHMPSDGREFARRILLGFQSAYGEAGVTPPVIEPETNAEYMAALSPSPAVAAEPDALRRQRIAALADGDKTKCCSDGCARPNDCYVAAPPVIGADPTTPHQYVPWRMHRGDCLFCGQTENADVHVGVAPPVMGDREAIARLLASFDGNQFEGKLGIVIQEHDKEIYRKRADRILSLHVQPGAGEREALLKYLDIFLHPNPEVNLSGLVCKHGLAIEACAARECSNPMAYETAIRRARDYVSRQAPPSSSETENHG